MKFSTLVLLCASSFFSVNALAQWQWIDGNGRKVFSDLPPPAQVPPERIIRGPAGSAAAARAASPAPSTQAPYSRASGVDQELQAKKSAKEAAQAQHKQAEEKEQPQMRADNCARAQAALITLADGRLVAHTNSQGERAFMDDSSRAAERQRAQSVIDADCGPAAQ